MNGIRSVTSEISVWKEDEEEEEKEEEEEEEEEEEQEQEQESTVVKHNGCPLLT